MTSVMAYRPYAILAIWIVLAPFTPVAGGDPSAPDEAARHEELHSRALQELTNVDLADLLRLRSARHAFSPVADEIGYYAGKGYLQRFRLNARRFDLSESDCVVFVERAVAMALATDWDSFYRLSERIRHKDGIVEYRNRNFHTLADWLPNNAWLLENITPRLGGPAAPVAVPFTHEVRPKVFEEFPAAPGSRFTRIIFKGSDFSSPPEIRQDMYIPKQRLHEVIEELQTGDVALILRPTRNESLGCSHLGFVERTAEAEVYFLSSNVPRVRRHFLAGPEVNRGILGFIFLRVREDARTIVAQELELLNASIPVPDPAVMDERVVRLRASTAQ